MAPTSNSPQPITDAPTEPFTNPTHLLSFAYQGLMELAVLVSEMPMVALYSKAQDNITHLASCHVDVEPEALHVLLALTHASDDQYLWVSAGDNDAARVSELAFIASKDIRTVVGIAFPMGLNVVGYLLFFNTEPQRKHEFKLAAVNCLIQQIKLLYDTQTQQAELLHEQKKYKALLQISGDGVHVFDRNGDVVDINDRFCTMLGYTRAELMGMNVADWDAMFTPELLADKVEDSFNEPAIFDTRHKRKDESIIDVEISTQPIWIDGRLYLWNASRDITARKNAERLKNGFISTVNHELRTPATSIIGALSLVLKSMADTLPVQVKNLLEIAHRNSERLVYLINDILDIEKLQANAMPFYFEELPIAELVAQSLVDTKAYGEKYNVGYEFMNNVGGLKLRIDKQRFMQVMANLVSNAYKFSHANAKILICVSVVENKCRISIEDYGVGIPEEFQAKMFMPFSQADTSDTRPKGGTGLGLSISKTIVEKMQGSIGFTSVLGKGTVFFVDFCV